MSNSCWDRFGRKTVLYFTGNKDTRVPSMEKELKRVGLDDADRQWQFPSAFDGFFMRVLPHSAMSRTGYMNNALGQYRAIATSYNLGCRNMLIIEDDIRFMKDISVVERVVESLPDDYDIAMFDCCYRSNWGWDDESRYIEWRDKRKINEDWSEFDRMFSAGCYALSSVGMRRIMSCYEAAAKNMGEGRIMVSDHYLDRDILGKDTKMYFNRENICIQKRFGNALSEVDVIYERYNKMGLDIDKYQE